MKKFAWCLFTFYAVLACDVRAFPLIAGGLYIILMENK